MGQKIKENDAKVEFFQVVFDVCFFLKDKKAHSCLLSIVPS